MKKQPTDILEKMSKCIFLVPGYILNKGGNIDLFLENVPEELMTIKNKAVFIVDLKKSLGDQKIDVVFKTSRIPQSKFQLIIC